MSTHFHKLAERWHRETGGMSNPAQIHSNENYLAIIGMGRDVIPEILTELSDNGGSWFAALRALTGVEPVPPADRGYVRKMETAWLDWGREEGYIE